MNHDERGGTSMVTSVALHIYYSEFMMHNISCCCIYSLYIVYTVCIYIYTVYIYIYIYTVYRTICKTSEICSEERGNRAHVLTDLGNLELTQKPEVYSETWS